MKNITKIIFSALLLALYTLPVFADNYWQIRAGAGVGLLFTDETTLGVTAHETNDTLTEGDAGSNVIATVGLGYVIPFECEDCDDWQFFPGIIISLDGSYQPKTNVTGDVWIYSDPAFDLYDYRASFENTNLMGNVTLGLLEYQRFTVFLQGGLGIAWTDVGYYDTPKPGVTQGNLALESQQNTTFAWQGGAGIGYALIPELDLTLTYLYTDLGTVETSSQFKSENNFGGTVVVDPAEFELHQQSLVLGVQWNFL
ncbi:MAG: outer membrane beta-barrel protein [Gammaproteobacteria bacterium]|jgi:opacity protein-like surface antigen